MRSKNALTRIQRNLNEGPRATLGYMTPSEKFAELVAMSNRIRRVQFSSVADTQSIATDTVTNHSTTLIVTLRQSSAT